MDKKVFDIRIALSNHRKNILIQMQEQSMELFSPLTLGSVPLKNRIVMAPLTRCRAVEEHLPNAMMARYYAQRASAGLIISEATHTSPMGIGYPCTPGLHTNAQVEGWKQVTKAVHDKGGKIFVQLWHVGRVSHSSFLGGMLPVAPSPVPPQGEHFTFEGMKPFETPHALSETEIKEIVDQFAAAAKLAMEAGFDGVEIHGANGYLIDQFLRDATNKRDDLYGGSIEKRFRFLREIIEAVTALIGNDRTGLRLSPSGTFNDMSDSDPTAHFGYICEQLNAYDLAYLHLVDALDGDIRHGADVVALESLRNVYKGKLIVCGEYTKERAEHVIEKQLADAVAFGTLFISNPDLPERFKTDAALNEPDENTYYTQDEKGYTDYPFL
jgi:N-ethylmaleimide reductase